MVNKDIYDKVMSDYCSHAVELSGEHFNFTVNNVKKMDLLDTYAKLQNDINGDSVIRVENPIIIKSVKLMISGKILPLDNGSLNSLYSGNYEDFLKSLDGTGVYRILGLHTDEDNSVKTGEVLDFVW